MDTATSDIRAVEFSPGNDSDGAIPPELLDHIAGGPADGHRDC